MRVVLIILVPAILLFGVALLLLWLPLPGPLPAPLSRGRNLMAAVTTGVLGLGYVLGLAVYVISSVRQAGQTLDAALTARGLASSSYLGVGRRYHGLIGGRQVTVYFMPAQGIQRALVDVHVSADLGARAALGEGRPLLDCRDCARVTVEGADWGRFDVYGEDETWVRRLLADPARGALLLGLLGDRQRDGLRELYLQPDQVWLRARPTTPVTGEHVQRWLDDVLALAQAAEAN